DMSGLSGMAIKTAFSVVKNIKAGFIPEVVGALLDDFLDALDPVYQEAVAQQTPPGEYIRAHAGRTADALLAVTDRRVARAERAVIKKTYEKLRPTAKKHVESATRRMAELLERHLTPEPRRARRSQFALKPMGFRGAACSRARQALTNRLKKKDHGHPQHRQHRYRADP